MKLVAALATVVGHALNTSMSPPALTVALDIATVHLVISSSHRVICSMEVRGNCFSS